MLKISAEFFPPSENLFSNICDVIKRYRDECSVKYISITHSASGMDKKISLLFLREIIERAIFPSKDIIAHLSCSNISREEAMFYVEQFYNLGIRRILVIKGGPSKVSNAECNAYQKSSDAIRDIKQRFDDIILYAACFSLPRFEFERETEALREKIYSGVTKFISQFCFTDKYLKDYLLSIRSLNIEMAIGVIIPTEQTIEFATKCGVDIPENIRQIAKDQNLAFEFTVKHIRLLESIGCKNIHIYTLNNTNFINVINTYKKK